MGNGLGFGRRPGDVIDKSRVSKVYYVQNELQTKFLKMLDNVTPQVMQAAERISLPCRSFCEKEKGRKNQRDAIATFPLMLMPDRTVTRTDKFTCLF